MAAAFGGAGRQVKQESQRVALAGRVVIEDRLDRLLGETPLFQNDRGRLAVVQPDEPRLPFGKRSPNPAAAVVGAALRIAGGGAGLTPALPLAWGDIMVVLPCPLIAAGVAALAARFTALRLIREMA